VLRAGVASRCRRSHQKQMCRSHVTVQWMDDDVECLVVFIEYTLHFSRILGNPVSCTFTNRRKAIVKVPRICQSPRLILVMTLSEEVAGHRAVSFKCVRALKCVRGAPLCLVLDLCRIYVNYPGSVFGVRTKCVRGAQKN
jgi:hypothetical protein